jgi:hypothetical protein
MVVQEAQGTLSSPVRKGKKSRGSPLKGKEVRPEEILPMEEGDFKDF